MISILLRDAFTLGTVLGIDFLPVALAVVFGSNRFGKRDIMRSHLASLSFPGRSGSFAWQPFLPLTPAVCSPVLLLVLPHGHSNTLCLFFFFFYLPVLCSFFPWCACNCKLFWFILFHYNYLCQTNVAIKTFSLKSVFCLCPWGLQEEEVEVPCCYGSSLLTCFVCGAAGQVAGATR